MHLTKENIIELNEVLNYSVSTFRIAFRRIIHNKKPEQDSNYISVLKDSLKRLSDLVRFLGQKNDKSGMGSI